MNKDISNPNKGKLGLPIVSMTLFWLVLIVNIISLRIVENKDYNDYSGFSGLTWLLFVAPISFVIIQACIIMAVMSLVDYFKDKKKHVQMTNFRKVLVVLLIIELTIVALAVGLLFIQYILIAKF